MHVSSSALVDLGIRAIVWIPIAHLFSLSDGERSDGSSVNGDFNNCDIVAIKTRQLISQRACGLI